MMMLIGNVHNIAITGAALATAFHVVRISSLAAASEEERFVLICLVSSLCVDSVDCADCVDSWFQLLATVL